MCSESIRIVASEQKYFDQMEVLDQLVFPTLEGGWFDAEYYENHLEHFPEGQFLALDDEKVVACTVTMRCFFDFDHPEHNFDEFTDAGWFTDVHQPNGDWLYGLVMGVHPD